MSARSDSKVHPFAAQPVQWPSAGRAVRRHLVMSEADMPGYGMHEPSVPPASAWVRGTVMIGGVVASWAMIALTASYLAG